MIPGELLAPTTAGGLLLLAVLMVLTGWLVPRSTHSELKRDRDLWRSLALRAITQNDKLLVGAEIAAEGLRALADVATESTEVAS